MKYIIIIHIKVRKQVQPWQKHKKGRKRQGRKDVSIWTGCRDCLAKIYTHAFKQNTPTEEKSAGQVMIGRQHMAAASLRFSSPHKRKFIKIVFSPKKQSMEKVTLY